MRFSRVYEKIEKITTTMPLKEKEVLHEFASKVPDGGIIVDIGTAAGNSAFIMALASKPSVRVWTIDPIENKNFLSKRMELGLLDRVHFIGDTSNNAVLDWDESIDLLFIDGLHSVKGMLDDINNWGKFVKKGSTILLHDYYWYGEDAQKAIDSTNIKLKLLDVPFGLHDDKKVGMAIIEKI